MSYGWVIVLLCGGLALLLVLVLLCWREMRTARKLEALARTPYLHTGWVRRDVSVVPRAFDWSRDEVTL